jgi:AbrB family looped-hinge helix DNA binding protein
MTVAVLTIRNKNQITIPQRVLAKTGMRQGDPIEVAALPDGGIAIYPFGHATRRRSVWDLATALAEAVPGIENTDMELPGRDISSREVAW